MYEPSPTQSPGLLAGVSFLDVSGSLYVLSGKHAARRPGQMCSGDRQHRGLRLECKRKVLMAGSGSMARDGDEHAPRQPLLAVPYSAVVMLAWSTQPREGRRAAGRPCSRPRAMLCAQGNGTLRRKAQDHMAADAAR